MEFDEFAELVSEALDLLPEKFQNALDNVEVVIEDWPSWNTMRMAHVGSKYGLLGFYHGVPLTERTSGYNLISPDKISIYQKPIEAQCSSAEQVRALVHRVVLHELAHHFGIDDNRLHEIGAY
ncbi:MAG: metallopeptidase family protein [Bacteroidota bacterium]